MFTLVIRLRSMLLSLVAASSVTANSYTANRSTVLKLLVNLTGPFAQAIGYNNIVVSDPVICMCFICRVDQVMVSCDSRLPLIVKIEIEAQTAGEPRLWK